LATALPVGLPPEEAIEAFRRKGLQPSFSWQDVYAEEHARAFTVAKVAKLDILEDIHGAVDAAIAEGETFADFKRRLIPTLQEKGWWGRGRMVDPRDGEEKDVQLGSVRRLRTIYDTNLRTAHAAGRWEQVQRTAAQRPFLRYVHLDNGNPREQHKAWHGRVLPAEDPWWRTAFPPNGWGCHCSVQQLSARDLARYGYNVSPSPPKHPITTAYTNPRTGEIRHLPPGISPGFDYNPGIAARETAARVLGERLAAAPAKLGAATWAEASHQVLPDLQAGFGRWVDDVAARREPQGDVHPLGAISPQAIARLHGSDQAPAAAGIVLRAPDLRKMVSTGNERLKGLSQRQRVELVRQLPSLLANPLAAWYDAEAKQLLYILARGSKEFADEQLLVTVARAPKARRKGTPAVNAVVEVDLLSKKNGDLGRFVGLTSLPTGAR
jgi:hypothetical protein